MNLLGRLLGHDAWTTWALLQRSHELTEAQLDQPHDLGWRTVRLTLIHILENMEVWTYLTCWTSRPGQKPTAAPLPTS